MKTEALIRLLAWLSPSFPTGAFAYSHGLEWAVEAGAVSDEPSLLGWLSDVLAYGSGHTDAVLLRVAWRTSDAALAQVAELAAAACPCRERRIETLAQGEAFARAAAVWGSPRLAGIMQAGPVAYPVAVGVLAADHGIAEDAVLAAYLQALATNLTSAAVRLIPLGQTSGLRVLAKLEPVLLRVIADTRAASPGDIGGACFRSDIAAMRHETQVTRLFRT